jgi:hypothetical protein
MIRVASMSTLTLGRRKEALALALVHLRARDVEDPHRLVDVTPLHAFFRRSIYLSPYSGKSLGFSLRSPY